MAKIDKDTLNSNIEYCIREYVRLYRDRDILTDKWFNGLTLEQIAEKYKLSLTYIKDIVYGIGDDILLRACNMSKTK